MKEDGKQIDLHPADYDPNWQPTIGNELYNGEKPHIWQEFKRDLHMTRKPGQPIIGRGWPIIIIVFLGGLAQFLLEIGYGPEWLIAARNLIP